MGKDLYYKQSPKPVEETYNSLSMSTWFFLKDMWGLQELEDIDGKVLTKNSLPTFETIRVTAEASKNTELAEDITNLMSAIKDLESITLYIRG